MTGYIFLGIVGVILVWLAITYNRFVSFKFRIEEALSDIEVQEKRRFDLIPNLIDTVKGYMKQEQTVLENVTKARTNAMSAGASPLERVDAENALSATLKTLFAVSESYPDLKSNANFLELQRELSDTENKMMAARRFFNSTVKDMNIAVEVFPSNIVANLFGFNREKFYEIENASEKGNVRVSF